MSYTYLIVLFSFLLLPGIALAFIPGIPGLLYMLMVAVIFGGVSKFLLLTIPNLLILGAIVLIAILFDIAASMIGAHYGGAHWKSLIAGVFGLFVGTFLLPIPLIGSLMGFFLGIFIAEFVHHHAHHKAFDKAFRAALGGFLGSLAGVAGNVIASIVFLVSFVLFALH